MTDAQKQTLGTIIMQICSSDKRLKKTGYISFFELRNQCAAWDFDLYILRLDKWRLDRGHRPLLGIIEEIKKCIIMTGQTCDCKQENADLPINMDPESIEVPVLPQLPTQFEWSDTVEQVDLFGVKK